MGLDKAIGCTRTSTGQQKRQQADDDRKAGRLV